MPPKVYPAFVQVDDVIHKMGTGCPLIPNVQAQADNVYFLPVHQTATEKCVCCEPLPEGA